MATLDLGDRAKDIVTQFTGIVTARSVFLNGCARVALQSEILKDGIPTEAQWFDEVQLELVEAGVVKAGPRNTGGPMPCKVKRAADANV
jgi:hypothetical protein